MASAGSGPLPLLFVYGSLLGPTGIARVDGALARCEYLDPARVPGRLYDLGDYPGAVPPAGPAEAASGAGPWIRGRLLRVTSPEALRVLDEYEGYDPGRPEAGEFLRRTVAALVPGDGGPVREVAAEIYWYGLPAEGRAEVPGGDWAAWRRRKHP